MTAGSYDPERMSDPGAEERSTTGQVQEKVTGAARQAAGQVQEKTQEARGQAASRLRDEVNGRSTQAGEQIRSTADVFRRTESQLREEGNDQHARIAGQAAERIDRLGGYLVEADADRILRDVEDFGRRQPLAVVAGGFVVGLLASRFLKASSSERYHARSLSADEALSQSYTASPRPADSRGDGLSGSDPISEPIGAGTGTRPTGLPAHE